MWLSKHDARRKESEVNGSACAVFVCVVQVSRIFLFTDTDAHSYKGAEPL